ncbi:MAG: HNH endonuclease [Planctomycetaceae bacterium]|nr:HNH endonuclease [Planctomycetaceae bacterium]
MEWETPIEQGYSISTKFTGRPDLSMGQYVLESVDRVAEPHDRNIPESIQKLAYERDRNTCRICGWNREAWRNDDPRILELHHLDEYQHGGQNTLNNLVVLCSRCHESVHAGEYEQEIIRIAESLQD